jgi:hypothetical protein
MRTSVSSLPERFIVSSRRMLPATDTAAVAVAVASTETAATETRPTLCKFGACQGDVAIRRQILRRPDVISSLYCFVVCRAITSSSTATAAALNVAFRHDE